MFYDTREGPKGLPHNPFKSCVVPRPIGWITTLSAAGVVNLAPYSFFNAVASDPPMVMFSSSGAPERPGKDTLTNCENQGEFVVNLATWELRHAMSRTSAAVPPEVDEAALAGLDTRPSRLVRPPRVAAAPIHLECRYDRTIELPCTLPGGRNAMVLGEVVGVHIRDEVLTEGRVDLAKIRPIARLGYHDYARVDFIFEMKRE